MKEIPHPDKLHAPEPKPLEFSAETRGTVASILTDVSDGKALSAAQTDKLMGDLSSDLAKNGIHLTKEEASAWKKSQSSALREASAPETKESVKADNIDLKEFTDTLSHLGKVYKLNERLGNVAGLESIILATKVINNLGLTGIMVTARRVSLGDAMGAYGAYEKLSANKFKGGDQWKGLGSAVWKVGWPLLAPIIAAIPANIMDFHARKALGREIHKTGDMVNKRIAESVFMRDFEFVHDKSAAEIMQVITRGKDATMNLMKDTYLDFLPAIAEAGTSIVPQLATNKAGAILGLAQAALSVKSGEKLANDVLAQRNRANQMQNEINTRILTSLSALEEVKTTASMDTAIGQLEQAMKGRDTIGQEMTSNEQAREKSREWSRLFMSLGIPTITIGSEIYDKFLKGKPKGMNLMEWVMQDEKAIGKAWATYMMVFQTMASFEGTQKGLDHIARTYVDKIRPEIQDVKRMEELLGPYELIDRPDGIRERNRIGVSTLPNYDIHVDRLNFKNILHDVSIDIPQGSFVTIKGPSGIGKTTFFRHLVGIYGASSGAVTYGGENLHNIKKFGPDSVYTKLAYANQNPQYFEDMTLRDNLTLWSKEQIPSDKIRQVLHDLRLEHLYDRMDSKEKNFSGGELRRIGIARALLKDPKVLFLDEPTANLDQGSAKQVLDIVKEMRQKRPDMTVVAVTHDANFEKIAEKIVDFADINRPKDTRAESLGTRQVFYASSVPDKI